MNDTTTDPALPVKLHVAFHDAVNAYGEAAVELNEAFHDREGVDRDLVVTLEDEEGRAREGIDHALAALVAAADAAGEARGRAAAVAEVDVAIRAICEDAPGWDLDLSVDQRGTWADDAARPWMVKLCEFAPRLAQTKFLASTPTAAILAAAVALAAAEPNEVAPTT